MAAPRGSWLFASLIAVLIAFSAAPAKAPARAGSASVLAPCTAPEDWRDAQLHPYEHGEWDAYLDLRATTCQDASEITFTFVGETNETGDPTNPEKCPGGASNSSLDGYFEAVATVQRAQDGTYSLTDEPFDSSMGGNAAGTWSLDGTFTGSGEFTATVSGGGVFTRGDCSGDAFTIPDYTFVLRPPQVTPACSDGIDNDGDGGIDFEGLDTDGDGVIDISRDPHCDSFEDTVEDAPPDRDRDGVPDSADDCPDVFAETEDGCPLPDPPLDSDGDRWPDTLDECPQDYAPLMSDGCPADHCQWWNPGDYGGRCDGTFGDIDWTPWSSEEKKAFGGFVAGLGITGGIVGGLAGCDACFAVGVVVFAGGGVIAWADPPDPNYRLAFLPQRVAGGALRPGCRPRARRESCRALRAAARQYGASNAQIASLLEALAVTTNRATGARQANDMSSGLLQHAVMKAYSGRLAALLPANHKLARRVVRGMRTAGRNWRSRVAVGRLKASSVPRAVVARLRRNGLIAGKADLRRLLNVVRRNQVKALGRTTSVQALLRRAPDTARMQALYRSMTPGDVKRLTAALVQQNELLATAGATLTAAMDRAEKACTADARAAGVREYLAALTQGASATARRLLDVAARPLLDPPAGPLC